MTDNIQIIEIETLGGIQTNVIIDNGNGEFTFMTKAHWDELEAKREQSVTLS